MTGADYPDRLRPTQFPSQDHGATTCDIGPRLAILVQIARVVLTAETKIVLALVIPKRPAHGATEQCALTSPL